MGHEKVCTHAAILKTGNLITIGNVEDILMDEDIVEVSAADLHKLAALLQNIGSVITIDEKAGTVQLVLPKNAAAPHCSRRVRFRRPYA